MSCRMLSLFVLAALLVPEVAAVTHGSDQYGNLPGYFYVFNATLTQIFEPSSGKLVKSIPFGVAKYGDAVYAEDQAQLKHYLFVSQNANNKVTVIDTDTQSVLTTVNTGKKPLHIFSVYYRDEVWIHLDGEGAFDVFNMANARFRSSSSVKATNTRIGHGKLMFHPAMEKMAYATNVNETGVHVVDITSRNFQQKVAISNANFKCVGTHGIDYSPVNNRIYAECSNPPTCLKPYNDPLTCTASLWTVNAATATAEARLSSPTLSKNFGGDNFGIQGQPYHSPDNIYLFVPNKNLDILHILQPKEDGTTNIIDVPLLQPGNIVFYPKNANIEYGTDTNPSNYIMALGYASGVAFLEMSVVVNAFLKGATTLTIDDFTTVATATNGVSRTIVRGNDYVVIPEFQSGSTVTTRLAVVSFKSKQIVSYISMPNSLKVAFVPIESSQLKQEVTALKTLISSGSIGTTSSVTKSDDNSSAAFILAIIAIALSALTLAAVSLLFMARRKDHRRQEMENPMKIVNP